MTFIASQVKQASDAVVVVSVKSGSLDGECHLAQIQPKNAVSADSAVGNVSARYRLSFVVTRVCRGTARRFEKVSKYPR